MRSIDAYSRAPYVWRSSDWKVLWQDTYPKGPDGMFTIVLYHDGITMKTTVATTSWKYFRNNPTAFYWLILIYAIRIGYTFQSFEMKLHLFRPIDNMLCILYLARVSRKFCYCVQWHWHMRGNYSSMMTSSHGSIFRVTGHLCGVFTGHWWVPRTKTSDTELRCFLWSAPEYTFE